MMWRWPPARPINPIWRLRGGSHRMGVLVPLTEKAGQRLLIHCLQLRDMLSKNASLPSAPHWSTSGDCAENCTQCRWHRIRQREQLYQVVGAGTSTIESVPCAIALVELAQTDPNRCAVLCANPWRRHRHHRLLWRRQFAARCMALTLPILR